MKKVATTLGLMLASVALLSPFAAYSQTDHNLDGGFNKDYYMKMADKDGMLSKTVVMKSVEEKFDKMQKDGMITVEQMNMLIRSLGRGK